MEMDSPITLFNKAEQFLRENGFTEEIERWDNYPSFDDIDETYFLTKYAWVVFSSGMSNAVIEAKWQDIRKAFRYFIPLAIVEHEEEVRQDALETFNLSRKVEGVITVAHKIVREGFEKTMKAKIKHQTLDYLDSLPMIGKVTKYHLARNLGFDYAKPDRHMVRLASKFGMTPFELCYLIHKKTGRRIATIDAILWRFCEQQGQKRGEKIGL